MNEFLSNPGVIALLGTLFGGAGLKFVEHWLNRKERVRDAGMALRDELRMEIDRLKEQMASAAAEEQRLEAEVERWRGMYYDLRDEKQRVVTELDIVLAQLRTLDKDDE